MQNETAKENLLRQIREYRPYNEQEERDRAILLKWMESGCDILTRENETAHLTVSAWVVNLRRFDQCGRNCGYEGSHDQQVEDIEHTR